MQLDKARLLVAQIFAMPVIHELAEKGDKLSSHQTDHGMKHFLDVAEMARKLCAIVSARRPGALNEWETDVIIPLASLFHDIGRAIDVEDHANAGARWAQKFLKQTALFGDDEILPRSVRNRICRIIACHRSGIVLNREFNDPAWAIVVLADKFVGDEERVRPGRALVLGMLTILGLPWIPLRKGGIHDRVNFAIKKVIPEANGDELDLVLVLDQRVCDGRLVLDTYSNRYLACDRAARYLGFKFRIRFRTVGERTGVNTEIYGHHIQDDKWLRVA